MALDDDPRGDNGSDETGSFSGSSDAPRTFSRLVVTQVQRGPPSRLARELGVQGRPMLSVLIAPTPPALARQSLEVHDRSARLRVFVDGAEVTDTFDDLGPDLPHASSATPLQDVEVVGLRQQVEEQRTSLRQLESQTSAATRFLELVMKEIAEAQARHAKVQTALEQATKTTQGHAQDLQDKEMRHVLAQVEELHRLDKEQVKKLHELAQESITMLGVSTQLQAAMRASLRPQTWRDTITATKELMQTVVQGPVAVLATGWMQSMVAQKRGHDVSVAQVLDAQVLVGEQARARYHRLRTLLAQLAPHPVTHTAAVVGDFLEGQVPLEAVAHVLQTHLARATVVQQGRGS
ncbi:hypothetical protein OV203_01610 [Nannocystis sp. ILAH1]|uniref:hypothetical protein n=1 Tax=Nannocystis sp. ILAH1 TaxID=2996789 RepID=UPI00226F82CE|nr:hypothetical protein [Nannocystis sp. ILAH1]MCY0985808.1 hypothetical protein [Nannocystis sp. ILAH1]